MIWMYDDALHILLHFISLATNLTLVAHTSGGIQSHMKEKNYITHTKNSTYSVRQLRELNIQFTSNIQDIVQMLQTHKASWFSYTCVYSYLNENFQDPSWYRLI